MQSLARPFEPLLNNYRKKITITTIYLMHPSPQMPQGGEAKQIAVADRLP